MEPVKDRIYAFDTIRTIMVLLGIVIHASILYKANLFQNKPFFNDVRNHAAFFNIIQDGIHIFRMPVFFTISGFFTALIFFERGVKALVSNRMQRLVYPFFVGLVILLPMHLFSLNFFALTLSGIDHPHSLAFVAVKHMGWAQINTAHLWFLYYLILYCATVLLLAYVAERWIKGSKSEVLYRFRPFFLSKAAPLLFAIPTLFCLIAMDTFDIEAAHSFAPDWGFYANYAVFFLFGWFCYGIKQDLRRFENQSIGYLVCGTVLFAARWCCLFWYHDAAISAVAKTQLKFLLMAMLALNTWFYTFGTIGFFVKYCNRPSPIARYLSDGSYWIYLIHMPIVIYLQALLLHFDLPVFVKFSVVLVATVLVTVLSYNYLVRNTFIGKFLNGRKYPRGF